MNNCFNEWLNIANLVATFVVPIITAFISARLAISESNKKFEKELKKYETELEKYSYKFSKSYDEEVKAYKRISIICANIWDILNSIFPVQMSDLEVKWADKTDIKTQKMDLSKENQNLRRAVKECYPFIKIDPELVHKIITNIDHFINSLDKYLDADDYDKQSHNHKTDLRDEAYKYIENYKKIWDELNDAMRNSMQ